MNARAGVNETSFRFDGGISEFADFLAPDAAVTDTWRLTGIGNLPETVPMLQPTGAMMPTEVERECFVDVAVRWGTGYDTVGRSFVNIIATPKGGTHQQGFELGLMKVIRDSGRAERASPEGRHRQAREGRHHRGPHRRAERAPARAAVRGPDQGGPRHPGRSPDRRERREPRAGRALRLDQARRQGQTALLLDKVVSEMKARISARTHKETQRRKNALESSSLPAKLADCRTNDVEQSELFIVEGDSALGTAKHARNSEYQALLPIRGKILNVQKASISDMLWQRRVRVDHPGDRRRVRAGRSTSIGARYGKIILMSDADVDGAHIRTLLLTLFFRYMRPLIERWPRLRRRAAAAPRRSS